MSSGPPDTTRRTVLKGASALLGLAATGSLAGCQEPFEGPIGGEDGDPTTDVPQGVDYVVHVDAAAILADEAVRDGIDATLAEQVESEDAPQSTEEALDQIGYEVGIDVRGLSELLVFGSRGEGPGVIMWTDWSTEELVDTIEQEGTTLETETYADRTVYVQNDDLLVPLTEDGVFTIGSREMAQQTTDVWDGDADSLDGELADLFGSLEAGYVRYATEMPESATGPSEQFPQDAFEEVTHVTGGLRADGEQRVQTFNLHTDSAETAEELADGISGFISYAQEEIQSNEQAAGPEMDMVVDQLDRVETSTEGSVAVIAYRGPAEEFAEFVTTFIGSFYLGLGMTTTTTETGSQSSGPQMPQISFSFEYRGTDGSGKLTITHSAGDTARVENLRIVGEGFADVDGVDMASPGQWQGTTSDGKVVAGERVTVGVQSDCEIRVVWEKEGQGAVLAMFEGPGA